MPRRKREPTEKTRTGVEVRVPKRGEFFDNLRKIAGKPEKPSGSSGAKK